MFRRLVLNSLTAAVLTVATFGSADAQGRIFTNSDEWTLSSTGIGNAGAGNVTTFTRNIASWLTGGSSGSVLIASTNFGFPLATISADLNSGGFAFATTQDATAAGWANRSSYDAVFVDATTGSAFLTDAQLQADLQAYVLGGGSVFANLGTGAGGPANEAARMNGFLGYFGLIAAPVYNGIGGVSSTIGYDAQGPYGAGLFTGVAQLYQNNGNDLSTGGPNTAGYTAQVFGGTLYGASARANVVPEPGTYAMMVVGLVGLGLAARSRRRS